MSELEIKQHSRNGLKKMKKQNTRVDLTPMVDLGFLLLTFFVFTTSISKPRTMMINVPKDGPFTNICNSCVLTLMPAGNNQIYYYEGAASLNPLIRTTTFAPDGLRKLILEKKALIASMLDSKKELVLSIKPSNESSYRNFVNVLDEVTINDVKHYFIAAQDKDDQRLLASFQ
ncbi:MAG: biopolymer transporter ExbD [Ferruginibacter sp.]